MAAVGEGAANPDPVVKPASRPAADQPSSKAPGGGRQGSGTSGPTAVSPRASGPGVTAPANNCSLPRVEQQFVRYVYLGAGVPARLWMPER